MTMAISRYIRLISAWEEPISRSRRTPITGAVLSRRSCATATETTSKRFIALRFNRLARHTPHGWIRARIHGIDVLQRDRQDALRRRPAWPAHAERPDWAHEPTAPARDPSIRWPATDPTNDDS